MLINNFMLLLGVPKSLLDQKLIDYQLRKDTVTGCSIYKLFIYFYFFYCRLPVITVTTANQCTPASCLCHG